MKKTIKKHKKTTKEERSCINTFDCKDNLILENHSISATAKKLKINSGSICHALKQNRRCVGIKKYRFVSVAPIVYAHDRIKYIGITLLQHAAAIKCENQPPECNKKPCLLQQTNEDEQQKLNHKNQRTTPFTVHHVHSNTFIGQFTSKKEAYEKIEALTGVKPNPGSVYQCLNGPRHHTGGFEFKYVQNDDNI